MNNFLSDTNIMMQRSMRHIFRSPDTIITITIIPIFIMLLFVYVFGGALSNGNDQYINYMLPGILLMAIASGIAYTAIRLFTDIKSGVFERFHSMPISGSAVLWGHVLASLVSNFISVIIIIGVALIMGFRTSAGFFEWFVVFFILALFTLALTWVAVIAGLSATTVDGAGAFAYPLMFLPFISSAFVETATMPVFVRIFADYQPVTSIVDAIRAFLFQQYGGNDIWIAIAWCLSIFVVAYLFAIHIYHKKNISR